MYSTGKRSISIISGNQIRLPSPDGNVRILLGTEIVLQAFIIKPFWSYFRKNFKVAKCFGIVPLKCVDVTPSMRAGNWCTLA
jgi:hypothetical protein